MLGDTAVAVHPDNERLRHLIGKTVVLPLVGRRIPIVGDDYADPEKGAGAVKITPAHDFNDFEVGRRHNLPLVNVLDADGKLDLRDNAAFLHGVPPSAALDETLSIHGLDRFAARKRIVEHLEIRGLLDKIEPTTHTVPHGDRSGAVVEPFLTDQWYVDAKTLAQPAIAAVRAGKTVFVPGQWEATFFSWMENIQPWCISRQIWWGHQIPAWYGPDGKIFVAESEDDAVADALAHYTDIEEITAEEGHDIAADPARRARFANEYLHRDEDVLDTWFSSALWPFSTLGWPDETPELKRYYPTSVLVTGFDIIFFWVARMMMMGLHFMREVPFHTVYIHALVRDASGAKMSKSKGNVIDPLELIAEYGADALRFTLASMAAQGRDIKLSTQRVEGYRNFVTKLWNATRFAEMNECVSVVGFDPYSAKETLNRWIAHETAKAATEITEAIELYRFNDAAAAAYRFVWNIYCDWYLELAKPVLLGSDSAAKTETRAMVGWARDEILKLLHPFMPFVTEELWQLTANRDALLVLTSWPGLSGGARRPRRGSIGRILMSRLQDLAFSKGIDFGGNLSAIAEIGFIVGLIDQIRSARTEFDIPARSVSLVRAVNYDRLSKRLIQKYRKEIFRLSHSYVDPFFSKLVISDDPDIPESVLVSAREQELMDHVVLPYRDGQLLLHGIDHDRQKAKYEREIEKLNADIARVDAKLGNPNFVARAPEDVVEEEKDKREDAQARKAKIAEALERLKASA